MAWDRDTSRSLSVLFDEGRLEEFRELLEKDSEYLRSRNGTDRWMWQAAMEGKLDFLKALVELGMDVNESHDDGDPNSQFYTPEGPILQAAGSGHLEVVRWLLDQGAQINFEVHGKRRCWPLVDAATNGHLEVVKLLVERGADIHATWRGVNAVTQAALYGHTEVRDYLRSLGARDLRETTPPNSEASHQRFIQKMTQFGPLDEWSLEIPGDPLVKIHLVPTDAEGSIKTVFTLGLSDHRLPTDANEFAATELLLMLPGRWPLTEEALREPIWSWPIDWMKRLVGDLRTRDRWPSEPALFMNGDPPAPLAPNTKLCGWLCMKSLGESEQMPDYRVIDLHSLFPIYEEERTLMKQAGHEELVERFMSQEIPLFIDPQRKNVAVDSA